MKVDISSILTSELIDLRTKFIKNGFDIKFVGGCVRDLTLNIKPKDVDLCTDANPDEQMAIYDTNNIKYIKTGLEHGTITVVINDNTYEITSLRTDLSCDGRHATVAYTKDWIEDLSRRDFTFNAMSIDFDGNLIDPFNGLEDLKNGIVKFVGDPTQRIQEDYLRIMRWYRFRGRYENHNFDHASSAAVRLNGYGLSIISVERIWSELSKILSGRNNIKIFQELRHIIGFDHLILKINHIPTDYNIVEAVSELTNNPITLLAIVYGSLTVTLLERLKASRAEIDMANWLWTAYASNHNPVREMAINGISREWAKELGCLQLLDGFDLTIIDTIEIPKFPVTGGDLINIGLKPSPEFSKILKILKEKWADSSYTLTKEQLLSLVFNLL